MFAIVVGNDVHKMMYYVLLASSVLLFLYTAQGSILHAVDIEIDINTTGKYTQYHRDNRRLNRCRAAISSGKFFPQPTTGFYFPDGILRNPWTRAPKPLFWSDTTFIEMCNEANLGEALEIDSATMMAVSAKCVKFNGDVALEIMPKYAADVVEGMRRVRNTCTTAGTTTTCETDPATEASVTTSSVDEPTPMACSFNIEGIYFIARVARKSMIFLLLQLCV
jgi:hypothetical protein